MQELNISKMQLTCYSMGSPGIFGLCQNFLHPAEFVVILCPESLEGRGRRFPQQHQEFPTPTMEVLD